MIFRSLLIIISFTIFWQLLISFFHLPNYILPPPIVVLITLWQQIALLYHQSLPTLFETLIGFICGSVFGIISALILVYFKAVRLWFLALLLISQALPIFAIAPLLVIWLGYGIASKIVMITLMLFFPVTSSFYDGLCQTPTIYLEMAKIANASKLRTLCYLQIPAALPSLASGLRMAAVYAPMGAIVGEWVGSSRGLGFIMLNANARMQINTMFATLLLIILLTLLFYFFIDIILKKLIWWKN